MRARAALIAYCVALAAVHGVVALWTPIQGDDWGHWVWASQHEGVVSWLAAHFTFSDAAAYVLARSTVCHALLTPVVSVALLVAMFTLAMKRLPNATASDLLGISLAYALIWFVQPRAGLSLFHVSNVALYVYGAAIAAWFVVPLRCGWSVPRWAWPIYSLAGYCVGTSSRAIATAVLVGFVLTLRRRRARWLWVGFAALLVGTIVGYVDPPWIAIRTVVRRGLYHYLEMSNLPIHEAGRAVSLVAALVLAYVVLATYRRGHGARDGRPEPADALCWLVASLLTSAFCLFGPRYAEATLFPVTCIVVIGALPWLLWLTRVRPLRFVIVALVIVTHAVVWPTALVQYHDYGAEGRDRWARLAAARGGTAVLEPYSQIRASYWFFGEDMASAASRQLIGYEVFGARDIELSSTFRHLEPNPDIHVALEIDGVPEAEQMSAGRPDHWGSVLSVARWQFEGFIRRLRARTGRPVTARLLVTDVDFPQRAGRPLVAAWARGTELFVPRISRSRNYATDTDRIKIYPPDDARFDEAWLIRSGEVARVPYPEGLARIQPTSTEEVVVVVCNAESCLVADAFIPRL